MTPITLQGGGCLTSFADQCLVVLMVDKPSVHEPKHNMLRLYYEVVLQSIVHTLN